MSHRIEKVASQMREILSKPVARYAAELTSGLVTVTSVRMTPDLRLARVQISILGGGIPRERVIEHLREFAGSIKRDIRREITMRYIPDIEFYLDTSVDTMQHMSEVISQARERTMESQGKSARPEDYISDGE